jgi:quinoprotein glucose dehydrogenase
MTVVPVALALAACSGPVPSTAGGVAPLTSPPTAAAVAAGDWPSYARDAAGTRFSPLADIDADNVADLKLAWTFALAPPPQEGAEDSSATTPLAIDGTLYVAAGDRVVALRGDTGAELWSQPLPAGTVSRRGLAYWAGDANTSARLYVIVGARLRALDAATGHTATEFGTMGEIAVRTPVDAVAASAGGLLLVGSEEAPVGVRAFDVQTGTELWAFRAAEAANAEPANDSLHAPWSLAVDVDRSLVYAAFSSGGSDDGAGPDTLVALELRTGRLRWRFEAVHRDLWGYGLPGPPALLDVDVAGRVTPVVAALGGSGFLYVLHRATGDAVFGVEERPVPGAAPGAATEPIPLKPPPLARVAYDAADLVAAGDTTAEHARRCRELRDGRGGLRNAGPFTPYTYAGAGAPQKGAALVFPGIGGAAGWGGIAVDPNLRFAFVNTTDQGALAPGSSGSLPAAAQPGGAMPFAARGLADEADAGAEERAWPCQKPPWGRLSAVNLATGDIAWSVPLGMTPELPNSRRQTGRPNAGGVLVTAGGIVLIGATDDRRLRAFNSRSGQELWAEPLPRSAQATPMTYLAGGKQFIAAVAAGDDAEAAEAPQLRVYSVP